MEHLLQVLHNDYDEVVSYNWKGKLFCGITLKWDYDNKAQP